MELIKLELKFATKKINPQKKLFIFYSEIFLLWWSYLEYKLFRVSTHGKKIRQRLELNWNKSIWCGFGIDSMSDPYCYTFVVCHSISEIKWLIKLTVLESVQSGFIIV